MNPQIPDVAGTVAGCDRCGTSIGPIVGPLSMSIQARCACGTLLEAWPAPVEHPKKAPADGT